jgi:hypothetical protein
MSIETARLGVQAFYCTSEHTDDLSPQKAGYPGIRQPEDAVQRFL